jgi:hypothetical protein
MKSLSDETKNAIAGLIETYRQGFLRLNPDRSPRSGIPRMSR